MDNARNLSQRKQRLPQMRINSDRKPTGQQAQNASPLFDPYTVQYVFFVFVCHRSLISKPYNVFFFVFVYHRSPISKPYNVSRDPAMK